MNGIDLIKWTRKYLADKGVDPEDMPLFTFRAQQMWELSPDIIQEIFDLGIKSADVFEKVQNKQQVERYLKRMGYFYRQLADDAA